MSVLNQERPANYQRIIFLSDFVTKVLCLLILLFLLPIFKIILGPHLSTARYIEAVLPAFNVFQSTPL